jgi:hypothetical protein
MTKLWQKDGRQNMSKNGSPYFCRTSFCHMKWVFIFAAVTLQAAPPPNIDKLAAEAMTELWQKYGRQNISEKMTPHLFATHLFVI